MIKRTGHRGGYTGSWLAIGCLLLLLQSTWGTATSEIPQLRKYQAGEKADSDINTPIKLVVKKRVSDIPEYQTRVFLYYPHAAAEAEARLREALTKTRSEFLDDLYVASKHRQLTAEQAGHPGFQRFAAWFQNKHKEFPFSPELARAWATGTPDEEFQSDLALKLREALKGYVVAILPEEPRDVRLVPVEGSQSI